jgi:hypothetical protein
MTDASISALNGLRDLTTVKWYVIPLLAMVFYVYSVEIKKARASANWNAVLAGLALFGTDFLFETINGWVFHFTQYSALWTTPGDTALRTMVGWNIEIMFMFLLAGIIYYHTLSEQGNLRILGVPEKLFWVVFYAGFCVFVECLLNMGGHLVWEYGFWKRSFPGVLPIFFCGYLPLFLSPMLIISMSRNRDKVICVGGIYAVALVMNLFGLGLMGWVY